MTRDEFEDIIKNGPKSFDIVAFREVSSDYIKFELKDNFNNALIVVEPIDNPSRIYGFAEGIEDIEISLLNNPCREWLAFAQRTKQELSPCMCGNGNC